MEKLKIYVGLTSWTETLFVYYTTQWFLYFEKSLIYKIINWRVPWKSHVVGSQLTLRSLVKKGLIRMIIVIKRSGCGKYCDNIVEKFSFVSWQIILATKIYLLKKKKYLCVDHRFNRSISIYKYEDIFRSNFPSLYYFHITRISYFILLLISHYGDN